METALRPTRGAEFTRGIRAGMPIALGYFAVSFSLGIAARRAGITPWQGFWFSALGLASAGEHAAFTVVAAAGSYLEMALFTLVANARYLLMSCAMSQRLAPDTAFAHRLGMGYLITDELFAVTIARPGYLSPWYMYGAGAVAAPAWAAGTALGIVAGQLLPGRLVSALGVALYGMFLAVIIPAARDDRVVAVLVGVSFLLSWLAGLLPGLSALSEGSRTILLTLLIAGAAAVLRPVEEEEDEE